MLVAPVLTLLLHVVVLRDVGPALTCTLGGVFDTAGLLPLRTCCSAWKADRACAGYWTIDCWPLCFELR
jgi:hypothetical protein